ncbi:MAG: FeoA family protein [Planctomycetia bacterium]
MNTLRLADVVPGGTAVVTGVSSGYSISSRLMEMGFVPGAVVQVLRRAPFRGPVQYRIQGVSVTMRPADACCVSVETLSAVHEACCCEKAKAEAKAEAQSRRELAHRRTIAGECL